ncbi:MAG: hypothetical protein IKC51_06160 [Myxococcaceae bacterium]|nr:hypothetical protein [Myxococcaceae bacterium]
MMNKMNSLIRSEEGQGMTEYIIIVALIAIAAIAVITVFGNNLRNLFATSANALGGATNAANEGVSQASVAKRGLKNFGVNTSTEKNL